MMPFLRTFPLLLLLFVARAVAAPNIVIFLADDLGRLDCSPYGAKDIRTPNMQRLADAGLTFENAYVTSPSCAPSRAALLTGLMPARNGAEPNHAKPRAEVKKWPAYFQALGYEVMAFGKVAHYKHTADYGFDRFAHDTFHDHAGIGAAVELLKSRPRAGAKPLCLFVGSNWPHVPWPQQSDYDRAALKLPAGSVDTPATREWRARYAAAVTKADEDLGAVMDAARAHLPVETLFVFSSDHGAQWPFGKWNLYESGVAVPLIIAWPGAVKPGTRTAAMVQWTDLLPTLLAAAGGTPPENLDGRNFLPVLRGESDKHHAQIFTTHSGDGNMNVYPMRAVREGQWKYIRNLHPEFEYHTHIDADTGRLAQRDFFASWRQAAKTDAAAQAIVKRYHERPVEELYDLANDPHEQQNLAARPEHTERLAALRQSLDDWMRRQGDAQKVYGEPRRIRKEVLPPVKVFILAGQSNMQGQAVVDLSGKDYNGGRGTLAELMRDPVKAAMFTHLRGADGKWTVRDDVWVRYRRDEEQPPLKGLLGIGYAAYGGRHHFGPELQFGHIVGDRLENPVLLIKTAWGGKSLYKDFRPPSSGGETGPYYQKMLEEVRAALAGLQADFPAIGERRAELAGFVWWHGWNDGCEPQVAVPQYEQNLVNLIKDVRRDLHAPKLPVVIGELTGPWVDAPPEWEQLREAQAAVAAKPEFAGTVAFVPTRSFVRRAEDSPNPTHGHHEFGNAETYFVVGDALGKAMLTLLDKNTAAAEKKLPLDGEVFTVQGRTAFLIPGKTAPDTKAKPWVWYAPTLQGLPGPEERWMFAQFRDAGIAVAGIDVRESYGSPDGRALFTALYDELTARRGLSKKPVLLGRSRGGLMTLGWAAENADKAGGFAGIYPVCNLTSYPGIEKAAPAYKLTPQELTAKLLEHNPSDRLAALAKAKVPLFAIHGDVDTVVPLEANSGLVKSRYESLGGTMQLVVPKGQGHNMWTGFFQCAELVAFVKANAK